MLAQSSLIPDLHRLNTLLKTCTDSAQEINAQNLLSRSPDQRAKTGDAGETQGAAAGDDFEEEFWSVQHHVAAEDRAEYLEEEGLEKQVLQESATEKRDETRSTKICSTTQSPEQTICDQELLSSEQTKTMSPKSILKSKKNLTDQPGAPERKFAQYKRAQNSGGVGGDARTPPAKKTKTKKVKFDLRICGDESDGGGAREHHLVETNGERPASPTMECPDRAPGQEPSDGWCRSDSGRHQQDQKFADDDGGTVPTCRNEVPICGDGCQSALDDWTSEEHENLQKEQGIETNSGDDVTHDVLFKPIDDVENGIPEGTGAEPVGLGVKDEETCTDLVERSTAFKAVKRNVKDIQSDELLEELVEKDPMNEEMNLRNTIVTDVSTGDFSPSHARRTSASAVEHRSPNMETPIHFANIVEIIHRDTVKTSYEDNDEFEIPDLVFSDAHAVVNVPESSTGAKGVRHNLSLSMQSSSPTCDGPETRSDPNDEGIQKSGSAHINSENEDTDYDEEDDGTMVIHDVENDNKDVAQPMMLNASSETHFTASSEVKIIDRSSPSTSDNHPCKNSKEENTSITSTALDDNKDDVQHTSINVKNGSKLNPLQTLDSSRLRTERGVYSRMFLRQFKSNIYKKKQTSSVSPPTQQPEISEENPEKSSLLEPSSSAAATSSPNTPSVVTSPSTSAAQSNRSDLDSLCTNADLMMKIDRISSLLDQFILSGSPTKQYLAGANHRHQSFDNESVLNERYSRVRSVRFTSRRRTCKNSMINALSFLIALFLYILSVYALLRISFFRIDVSWRHNGVVPV